MSDFLFDAPWWLVALAAVAGIGMLVSGNTRLDKRLMAGGLGVVGLAGLLVVFKYFVPTDSKEVTAGTRRMIASAEKQDWTTFAGFLEPDATLTVPGSIAVPTSKLIVAAGQAGTQRVGLKSAYIRSLQLQQTGTLITATFDLLTTEDIPPTEESSWQLDWEKTSAGWKVHEIRALTIKGVTPEMVRREVQ